MDLAATQKANEALGIVCEISNILGTGLDRETLAIIIGLLETGVNPEALATVVRELRREAAAVKADQQAPQAVGRGAEHQ
eukprot:364235-Chlamydomonas_euryale.AAC.5